MTWWFAGASAVLSLAGSLEEEADQNDAMEQKAADFGTRKAGIVSFQRRQRGILSTSIQEILEAGDFAEQGIDSNQAQAEAQARVNAAQAGVGGTSTDQIINETSVNAEKAKQNATRQTDRNIKQAKTSFVERSLQAENQIGKLDTSTVDQTGKHVLSFASGFAGGL